MASQSARVPGSCVRLLIGPRSRLCRLDQWNGCLACPVRQCECVCVYTPRYFRAQVSVLSHDHWPACLRNRGAFHHLVQVKRTPFSGFRTLDASLSDMSRARKAGVFPWIDADGRFYYSTSG